MFEGALSVDYGGVLPPPLLETLAEANGDLEVNGHQPLTTRATGVDRALYRTLPFLRDPATRVEVVRMRRGA